jgi:hypothetical protein
MPNQDSAQPGSEDQPPPTIPAISDVLPSKTADRPHRWTIALGIVAIIVSASSIFVSAFSAHLAIENYRLQNRAWLYVKEVTWESYWFRATLINRGKTPTNNVEPTCTELDVHDRSGNKPTVIGPVPLRFGPIPPDQTEDLTLGIPHDNNNPPHRTTVSCRIDYLDVFRQRHQLNLCYVLMHGGDVSVGQCVEGNDSN